MNALQRMLEDYTAQALQPEPGERAAVRRAAAEALRRHALPTRRDENWRYTNLAALDALPGFRPRAAAAPLPAGLLPAPLAGYGRLVWIDGRARPELSLPDPGLAERLGTLPAAGAPDAFELAGDGRFGLVASLFAGDPLRLRLSGAHDLEFIAITTAGATAAYTDIELQLAPQARVRLVERQLGAVGTAGAAGTAGPAGAPGALCCARLKVSLEEGAALDHTRLQQTAPTALYYDTLSVTLAAQARYSIVQVAAGGAQARSSAEIRLLGRGAQLRLRALATAHAAQVSDAYVSVLHQAPDTHSDQLFRGIAGERARIACSANVEVDASARGARVLQSLRGLIDGGTAEIDLRPRLTINTDDIQAAHGATTGRLNDDLLFYLLARGLDPVEARSLLKWAFLGEALSAIELPALRNAAERATAGRLMDAPAAELLAAGTTP